MALLTILEYPDPRLHRIAEPVTVFDAALKELADDMIETMYAAKGLGLAATQVNVHQRLFVMDLAKEKEQKNPQVFVNPVIIERTGECIREEGCLSVPGIYEKVKRAETVRMTAQNIEGQPFEMVAEGLMADCFQHEIDHLNGMVFIQHLSQLKLTRAANKLKKMRREQEAKR